MCGIAGLVNVDGAPASPAVLEAMLEALAHRGPDGAGEHVRGALAIGHRRLAIIDPAGGAQPIANEDGSIWVSCNGEIYNHRELRQTLLDCGHRFRSQSDCEVVVHAYEQWGKACVEHLRGMFAIAVADWRDGRLFLARDQLGIKPLYYLHQTSPHGSCFAFASELQALRTLPGITWQVDRHAIDHYLALQYIPSPRTAFQGVSKLPAGHRMSVSWDGRVDGPEPYWRLSFKPDHSRSPAQWEEDIDTVLRESVRAHLIADVPYGALLSGGLDSSAMLAYVSLARGVQGSAGPLPPGARTPTFSIGFSAAEFDERPYARRAAQRWGADYQEHLLAPDVFAMLPQVVRHHGEPFGDSSALAMHALARLARTTVPLVLSGDGGDEAFAGYASYGAWMSWLSPNARPPWWHAVRALAGVVAPGRYPPRQPTPATWLRLISSLDAGQRRQLWRPEQAPEGVGVPEAFRDGDPERSASLSPTSLAQSLDIATYLPDCILAKVDRASMAHSLEVRTPFVDRTVLEFAATIPAELNLAEDTPGRWQGKVLLKRVLSRYYSADFINRPKQGFAVPLAQWLAPHGELVPEARERLLGSTSTLGSYFRPAAITRMVRQGRMGPIWHLLVLDEWLRQNRTGVAW